MKRILSRTLLPAALALSLPSCGKDPPTTIVVAISSEAPIPRGVDAIRLQVIANGDTKLDRTYPVSHVADLPGTIVVNEEDPDEGGTVKVILTAYADGTTRVARSSTLGFSKGKQKLLRMPIQLACFDNLCEDGATCHEGACVPDAVDEEALPDFAPEKVFPVAGACFDRAACVEKTQHLLSLDEFRALEASDPTFFDRETCTVASSDTGENQNMGLFWDIVDGASWTAVDFDAEEGWQFADDSHTRIKLPLGLCNELKKPWPRITHLLTAAGCAPKPPTLPECPDTTD